MAISRGTSATNTASGTVTTCAVSPTLTAGRSISVRAGATQTGGGTRTMTAASNNDGSLGAADSSTGALATPSYVWMKNAVVGGATTVTVTIVGGNAGGINVELRELAGGALTLDKAVNAAQTATAAWDTGLAAATTHPTDYALSFGYCSNRNDLDSGSTAGNDGNANNYAADLGSHSASGESTYSEDIITQLVTATQRKATITAPAASTGRFHALFYYIAAAAGPTIPILEGSLNRRRRAA